MTKLNKNVMHYTIKCHGCNHMIIYVGGMWHHLYENYCSCLCNWDEVNKSMVKRL